jgi:hypothetical protein
MAEGNRLDYLEDTPPDWLHTADSLLSLASLLTLLAWQMTFLLVVKYKLQQILCFID